MQRTAGEDHAVLGFMCQLQTFGRAGEHDAVFSDDSAAAQSCKSNIARLARASVTVAALDRIFLELSSTAFRCRTSEQQGRARRRIDFLVVMHLQDFDIE